MWWVSGILAIFILFVVLVILSRLDDQDND